MREAKKPASRTPARATGEQQGSASLDSPRASLALMCKRPREASSRVGKESRPRRLAAWEGVFFRVHRAPTRGYGGQSKSSRRASKRRRVPARPYVGAAKTQGGHA
jgi:hypothetical protein